jgi:Na+/melibiose symporter-like transporter
MGWAAPTLLNPVRELAIMAPNEDMTAGPSVDESPTDETSALLPTAGSTRAETEFLHSTSPGRFWAVFLLVLVVQFVGCFDMTITASSHPAISSSFGAAHLASWLSTSFLLTSTACQPFVGRLSDAVGRKPPFIVSLALFTVATAWCAVAGSMETLILARALCGIGAGSLMTLVSIVVTDIIPVECVTVHDPLSPRVPFPTRNGLELTRVLNR